MSQTNQEPRNVGVVISQMKQEVPIEQESLHNRLNAVLSSAAFRAPEIQIITWGETKAILEDEIKPPLMQPWQYKVIAIFMDKTEEEIKSLFGGQ